MCSRHFARVGSGEQVEVEQRQENNHQARQACQYQHPEPEEDVDLLIEDVQWQYAEGVVFLQFSRGAEFMKSTFRQPEIKN